jgi:hypothetical protein
VAETLPYVAAAEGLVLHRAVVEIDRDFAIDRAVLASAPPDSWPEFDDLDRL